MYQTSWANITRSEDAIWKVFAAYTALFAGLAVAKDMIDFFGFTILIVIFSSSGMLVSINANQWFVRNLAMISNLEKEFLSKDDYGTIIPKKWAGKGASRFFRIEIWLIMFFLFSAVSAISIYLLYEKLSPNQLTYVLITLVICWLIVFVYTLQSYSRHKRFTDNVSGKV